MAQNKARQLQEAACKEFGKAPGELVTFADFQRWALASVEAMSFLHPLKQVARVELGVRPATPHGEARVIEVCCVCCGVGYW